MTALPRREQNRREKLRRLLDAALAEFSREGFSGTTMDGVAARAGLSKPTLYQYFASKDELFTAMLGEKRALMTDVFHHDEPMVPALWRFAWDYADTVMRPEMLALARLIIGEVARFPEIARAYQASGPDQLFAEMTQWLERQRAAGRLAFDAADLAAEDLWGLILSAPRTRALHDALWRPTRAELARYVTHGLRVFLRAYATDPATDLAQLEALVARSSTGMP